MSRNMNQIPARNPGMNLLHIPGRNSGRIPGRNLVRIPTNLNIPHKVPQGVHLDSCFSIY